MQTLQASTDVKCPPSQTVRPKRRFSSGYHAIFKSIKCFSPAQVENFRHSKGLVAQFLRNCSLAEVYVWAAATFCRDQVFNICPVGKLWNLQTPELPKALRNLHVPLTDSLYSKCLFYFSTCGNQYTVDNENNCGAKHPNWIDSFSRTFHANSQVFHTR